MFKAFKISFACIVLLGVLALNTQHALLVQAFSKVVNTALPVDLAANCMLLLPVWTDGLVWGLSVLAVAAATRLLASKHTHLVLALAMLAYLIAGVGPVAFFVVVLWLASAWCLGSLALRFSVPQLSLTQFNLVASTVVGGAIWLAVSGALVHFPINTPQLYIGLCLIPIGWAAWTDRSIVGQFRIGVFSIRAWVQVLPFWAWTLGLAIIGWSLRWSFFPSVGFDDHAYHLRLWTELLNERKALFDVHAQIWSVAPFASDLLHASLSLMAGSDARSAYNLVLAVVLLSLMARILHRAAIAVWVQWLTLILLASTPMLGNLLLSLQTELLLAVVVLAGLNLVMDSDDGLRGHTVLGLLACAALCAAIKLPGALLGVTLFAALGVRWWTMGIRRPAPAGALQWQALFIVLPLSAVALHSYVLAWLVTGNPVFPLYNAIFHSPYFPNTNFRDLSYTNGVKLDSYLRVFFHTEEFSESIKYSAGWQYLFILPFAILHVFWVQNKKFFAIFLIPLFMFGIAMFYSSQYWRYLFPLMPVSGLLMASLLVGPSRLIKIGMICVTIICIVLNIALYSRTLWIMSMPVSDLYSKTGREKIERISAPAVVMTNHVNQIAPGSRVLYPTDAPYGATLNGSPLYSVWYAPDRYSRFTALTDAEGMARFLNDERVDMAIFSRVDDYEAGTPKALLREYLARYGSPLAQAETAILFRLSSAPVLYRRAFALHPDATPDGANVQAEPALRLPLTEQGIAVTTDPKVLVEIPTDRAKQVRYSVRFRCPTDTGYFIAQIYWDKGVSYYRLVACKAAGVSFIEAAPVPVGATLGAVYVTTREAHSAWVEDLQIELQ